MTMLARARDVILGRLAPQLDGFTGTEPGGDVSIERVMRGCLIGYDVRGKSAADQRREYLRAVADEPHRERFAASLRVRAPPQRLVERRRRSVEIAGLQPALHAGGVHPARETDSLAPGRGERLGPTHAAEATRAYDSAAPRPVN